MELNDKSVYIEMLDGSWKEVSWGDVDKYHSYGNIVKTEATKIALEQIKINK